MRIVMYHPKLNRIVLFPNAGFKLDYYLYCGWEVIGTL